MKRGVPASSMQKTYDDCYLICSTAVYFENHNNEEEALRSWRDALDQIYYHNAYRIPAGYQAKSATEKALQDSLTDMETQCRERVELLETLQKSRQEPISPGGSRFSLKRNKPSYRSTNSSTSDIKGMLGDGTVPAANYMSISRPVVRQVPPPPPPQPKLRPQGLPDDARRAPENSKSSHNTPPPLSSTTRQTSASTLPPPPAPPSRTPSPDKRYAFKATLRSDKNSKKTMSSGMRSAPPPQKAQSAAAAASLAWPGQQPGSNGNGSARNSMDHNNHSRTSTDQNRNALGISQMPSDHSHLSRADSIRNASPADYKRHPSLDLPNRPRSTEQTDRGRSRYAENRDVSNGPSTSRLNNIHTSSKPSLPATKPLSPLTDAGPWASPTLPSYRAEYPASQPINPHKVLTAASATAYRNNLSSAPSGSSQAGSKPAPHTVPRKPITSPPPNSGSAPPGAGPAPTEQYGEASAAPKRVVKKTKSGGTPQLQPPVDNNEVRPDERADFEARAAYVMKHLPKGVDEAAAKAIFNEIVIKGDEVHWDDVAGLDVAKNALKEAVVYPFLRPDLFLGLREPARGMLLFGPPGTGKTMLARAVATESRSTFFAISASSLTSKFLGESEKLVRALFQLAKALAPSIIFVDEIDSLLSARGGGSGGGEHEATRRIKTEFLIQWSDLAKAAAGRDQGDGDATRVLVLAATNLPWAIDEAARRRFVRRQYIPLPEPHVRESQLRRLMSLQKHNLRDRDWARLCTLTDSFSGSDITALAKDAAMGPLRSLGERLLHMAPGDIRPIQFQDFESSLINIRPSVSKQGLQEFEDWARDFGERGG